MVVEARSYRSINGENEAKMASLNGEKRRRRMMDIKFSFMRKKKSRLERGKDDTGEMNGCVRHQPAEQLEKCSEKSSKTSDDRPRSIFSKIFRFRRDHRKNDKSLNTGCKSKSIDCLAPERSNYVVVDTSTGNRSNVLQPKENVLDNGTSSFAGVVTSDMSTSISSPNLTSIKWRCYDSFEDTHSREKYASFRRSRASMVFPIPETVENDIGSLHSSSSERQLQQTPQSNANNSIFAKSCLPNGINKKPFNEADDVCARNTRNETSLLRTSDGKSPHPGRRNPFYDAFSSPNIPEENDKRAIHTRIYQFTSVEDVKQCESHHSQGVRRSNPKSDIFSPSTIETFETKEGEDDDDFVFVTIGGYNAIQAQNKKLSRYISCPGNLQTESSSKHSTSSFPLRGSAPYSSHRRPYSVHESVLSLNLLETNDVGIDIEMDEEEEADSEFPPEDDLNLPSKVILQFSEILICSENVTKHTFPRSNLLFQEVTNKNSRVIPAMVLRKEQLSLLYLHESHVTFSLLTTVYLLSCKTI